MMSGLFFRRLSPSVPVTFLTLNVVVEESSGSEDSLGALVLESDEESFFSLQPLRKKTIRESEANPRVEESFVILILGKFFLFRKVF